MHPNFQGLANVWDDDYFDYFCFFSKDSAKSEPKVKQDNKKIKNDDVKTGITQV